MFFLVSGASGSGKSRVLGELRRVEPGVMWLDFDDGEVPPDAGKSGRQRRLEDWLRIVLGAQERGQAVALFGQSPLGELLAAPSAVRLGAVRALLLDVGDVERVARLRRRGTPEHATQDMLNWAAWHRLHASDPTWRPDVLSEDGWPAMDWTRWRNWAAGDPRWRVGTLDTTGQTVARTTEFLRLWVEAELSGGERPVPTTH